jgi:arsenate reductase
MGCGDTCPVFPGKSYQEWVLDDPAGLGVEAVRPIRDEIERRVRALLAELHITAAG